MIPISSQKDADKAISQARANLAQGEGGVGETASEDLSDSEADDESVTDIGSVPGSPRGGSSRGLRHRDSSTSGIAEDVIGKKVPFGRFAANWLSRKTLGLPGFGTIEQEKADIPLSDIKAAAERDVLDDVDVSVDDEVTGRDVDEGCALPAGEKGLSDQTVELMPKLLRYTKLFFAGQNFFFAYDYDLSRQVTGQPPELGPRRNHVPLHRMVDPLVGCIP